MTDGPPYDFAIVGAGFYGLALALFLHASGARVVVVEKEENPCTRASRVNQARVHTGYHYPRSFVTAMRSLALHRQFIEDFPEAIVDDFDMLYAIARRRSKVSPGRFKRMYEHLGAPIEVAPRHLARLFDERLVESVFRVQEFAFDYRAVRDRLVDRLTQAQIPLLLGTEILRLKPDQERVVLVTSGDAEISAGMVFNVTYAGLNPLLISSALAPLELKHEFVELALVDPVDELAGLAVTVMDGPFFSLMPYPAADAYSLTHVRYTPHVSWTDRLGEVVSRGDLIEQSRWRHMKLDAQRYMPCLAGTRWRESLFDIKTIAAKSELDDGRPIVVHRHPQAPKVVSIMGAKIDNIYDLFSILPSLDARLSSVHPQTLFARR